MVVVLGFATVCGFFRVVLVGFLVFGRVTHGGFVFGFYKKNVLGSIIGLDL